MCTRGAILDSHEVVHGCLLFCIRCSTFPILPLRPWVHGSLLRLPSSTHIMVNQDKAIRLIMMLDPPAVSTTTGSTPGVLTINIYEAMTSTVVARAQAMLVHDAVAGRFMGEARGVGLEGKKTSALSVLQGMYLMPFLQSAICPQMISKPRSRMHETVYS